MESFIERFGLFAVFVGAMVEGDSTLLVAGVVAHLGLLRFSPAVACGCAGAFVGDCITYGVGRARADAMRASALYRRLGPHIEHLAGRFGAIEIMLTRFIYGPRVASMLFWGVQGFSLPRFVAIDLCGCSIWAVILASLGFAFSGSAEMLIGKVKRLEVWLLIAVAAAAGAVIVIRLLWRPRLRRQSVGNHHAR